VTVADYTSTTNVGLPSWLQPQAAGYINRAQAVADTPYQAYTGQRVAGMTDWQQQGLQAQAQRGMSGSATMNAANNTLTNTLNGGFLNANPYLDQAVSNAQGDLTKSWNNVQKPAWEKAMQGSGSFGNSGVMQANASGQDTLQQNLGRISTDMRGAAYNQERGYMNSALGLAPSYAQNDYNDINAVQSAGAAYQKQNQAELDNGYQQYLDARNYPQQQLDNFGNALGRVNFGQQSSQTQPGPSTGAQVAGGAVTGAALYNLLFRQP
jgi:hypothetical protein